MRDVEIDVTLLGRVLIAKGLRFRGQIAGRGYDMRPVRPGNAGSWLEQVLESYEERTNAKPTQFSVSNTDILILAH